MKTFTILLLAFIALHTENLNVKILISIILLVAIIYEIYFIKDNNNDIDNINN